MNLEDIMLHEIKPDTKEHMRYLRVVKFIETESKKLLGAGGEGETGS